MKNRVQISHVTIKSYLIQILLTSAKVLLVMVSQVNYGGFMQNRNRKLDQNSHKGTQRFCVVWH